MQYLKKINLLTKLNLKRNAYLFFLLEKQKARQNMNSIQHARLNRKRLTLHQIRNEKLKTK